MKGTWGSAARIAAIAGAAALAMSTAGTAAASTTYTFAPTSPTGTNVYPFGIGGAGSTWGPYFGTIYQNLPGFEINPGDTLAFDLNMVNDVDVQLQIEMAPTTTNGGENPAGSFTTVVPNTQVPLHPRGNTVTGDYELQFTSIAHFSFPGGGLILRFSHPAGAFGSDATLTTVFSTNLALASDPSGLFVRRYRQDGDGLPPYPSNVDDGMYILPFRLVLTPPPPPVTTPSPSNQIKLGQVIRDKKHGTAILPVTVPGPGTLALTGTGVQAVTAAGARESVAAAGTVNLLIRPMGKTKRKLRRNGRATANVSVTFTPTGGQASTQPVSVKLKRKR